MRVGVDLVRIDRVSRLLANHDSAEERLFTEGERAYCGDGPQRGERLAARFAAKEAVGKALGTGIGGTVAWTDVEVVVSPQGRPRIRLHGEAQRWAERHGLRELDVSLSHTDELAVAYVVALVSTLPEE